MTTTKPLPPHGSLYRHKGFSCNCGPCRQVGLDYQRTRYRRIGYGTWQPLVDAEPVRQHIDALRRGGASIPSIAAAASVSTATLARLLYGMNGKRPTARLRTESADALLAVQVENCEVPDGARIDGTGTRRRIQGLVVAGWPFTVLGPEIGIHNRPLGALARATQVSAGSARKVKAGCRRLATYTPEQFGVPSQARSLARRVAAREGWLPLAAWDDIDDPACEPDLGSDPSINRNEIGAYRRREISYLDSFGIPEHEIAERLGMARAYVHDLIRDMRKERLAKPAVTGVSDLEAAA
jgi:AraC-like DNA-binding protein